MQDDWNSLSARIRPYIPAQVRAGCSQHVVVHDDQVGQVVPQATLSRGDALGSDDLESFSREEQTQDGARIGIVIDYQNEMHHFRDVLSVRKCSAHAQVPPQPGDSEQASTPAIDMPVRARKVSRNRHHGWEATQTRAWGLSG